MKPIFAAVVLSGLASAAVAREAAAAYDVRGDAIPASLTGRAGDPAKGADLMSDRQRSLCVLCHSGPFSDPHMQGNIAPSLAGIGGRLSAGQIRLRVVNMKALNKDSLMPVYLGAADRSDIAEAWRGRPILQATEIEDVVAYLVTLRE